MFRNIIESHDFAYKMVVIFTIGAVSLIVESILFKLWVKNLSITESNCALSEKKVNFLVKDAT